MTAVAAPVAPEAPPAAAPAPAVAAAAPAAVPVAPAPVAAAAPVTPAVPESYPLALRDGSPLAKDAAVQRITERAKALGITDQKVAQAFVDAADTEVTESMRVFLDSQKPGGALHSALVEQYRAESLKHPRVGNGDPIAFAKVEHEAGLAAAEHFPGLYGLLKESGLSGRWEVLADLSAFHRKTQESPLAGGRTGPIASDQPWETRMYSAPGMPDPNKVPTAGSATP